MDTSALNYNPSATIDDGSCILGATWVTLQMNDSYGDGWNGDTWSAISTIGASGHGPYTLINTSSGSQSFLLPDDCYDIICDFGSYPFETSWLLIDDNGITLASGGSPYNSTLATGTGSCPILGCTDNTACNYNEEAMEDDGSCAFPGMTCVDVNTLGVYDDNCECVDDANGVSNLPVNRTIKIYPNPSSTHVTIENPNQETVWIFDTMGRKVYSSMDREMVLCQDDFTPGSYFVKMGVRSARFVFE
jgi:hypothetical protein